MTLPELRQLAPRGSTVWTLLQSRTRSRTGATKVLRLFVVQWEPDGGVFEARSGQGRIVELFAPGGRPWSVQGSGFDAGINAIQALAAVLWDEPQALKQEWL